MSTPQEVLVSCPHCRAAVSKVPRDFLGRQLFLFECGTPPANPANRDRHCYEREIERLRAALTHYNYHDCLTTEQQQVAEDALA